MLLDRIMCSLPGYSMGHRSHKASSTEKNAKVWRAVFESDAWLRKLTEDDGYPILLGASIEDLYHSDPSKSQISKPAFWVLVIGNPHDYHFEKDLFLRCLQSHIYCEETCEVHLFNGLTLNVSNVVRGNLEDIALIPTKLFRARNLGQSSELKSYYVYWNEYPELNTVNPARIGGIKGTPCEGSVRRLSQISHICQNIIDGNWVEYLLIFNGLDGTATVGPSYQQYCYNVTKSTLS